MVLGIGERTVIIRLSQEAAEQGLSADSIAKRVQESMRDFVESGGGHARAGAIRVKMGFASAVAEEIVKAMNPVK